MTSLPSTPLFRQFLLKHGPVITKSCSHSNNPWYSSYLRAQALKYFLWCLEYFYKCNFDPQLLSALKSETNKYYNLLATAKKRFYFSLFHSRSYAHLSAPRIQIPFHPLWVILLFLFRQVTILHLFLQSLLSKTTKIHPCRFSRTHSWLCKYESAIT